MKSTILGFFAFVAVASASVVQLYPSHTTLLRTPSLDSAVIHSDRQGGSFSYSTSENHAYTPLVHSAPLVQTYNVYPHAYYPSAQPVYTAQHPLYSAQQPLYIGQQPVYTVYPSYYPTLIGAPSLPGGVNPENPIEVEDPADNTQNESLQQQQDNGDDDTVAVDSA